MSLKQSGFTLLELLVVISIIGFLAAAVLVTLNSARAKSRDARRLADMHQVQSALELYYNTCTQYPTSLTTSANNGGSGTCVSTFGNFLQSIPPNPPGCTISGGSAPAGADTVFGYSPLSTPAAPTDYTVYFCTEGAVSGSPITGASSSHTLKATGVSQ